MAETTSEKEFKDLKHEADEIKADAEEIKRETHGIKEELDEIKEEVEEIREEVSKSAREAEDYKSKYFYLAAEMDNARKRFEREKSNLLKFGNEKVLSELIQVVDNLDRTVMALQNEEDEKIKNIVQGVNMVREQFLGVLKKNGLEEIESVGLEFDPRYHEAMAQQAVEGKKDQEIIQEFQKGYMLNGRLLRAAKVVVAKNA